MIDFDITIQQAEKEIASEILAMSAKISLSLGTLNEQLREETRQAVIAFINSNHPELGDSDAAKGADIFSLREAAMNQSQETASKNNPDNEIETTEDFILSVIGDADTHLSVQQIVDLLKEADLDVKRSTLVVQLNRLVKSKILVRPEHGHFRLADDYQLRKSN